MPNVKNSRTFPWLAEDIIQTFLFEKDRFTENGITKYGPAMVQH